MGNTLRTKKTVKIMKINGETFKLKSPVKAGEVIKDYPSGYVLIESENVKHYGVRAKPIELNQTLDHKRLYFLVELPKLPEEIKETRRVKSAIQMSAKDKLESLMLKRRSVSDLSIMKPSSMVVEDSSSDGVMRVRIRLPKSEVSKLLKESGDEGEAAQKIMDLCLEKRGDDGHGHNQLHWEGDSGAVKERCCKALKKRVSFEPIHEGEGQIAVPSS